MEPEGLGANGVCNLSLKAAPRLRQSQEYSQGRNHANKPVSGARSCAQPWSSGDGIEARHIPLSSMRGTCGAICEHPRLHNDITTNQSIGDVPKRSDRWSSRPQPLRTRRLVADPSALSLHRAIELTRRGQEEERRKKERKRRRKEGGGCGPVGRGQPPQMKRWS